VIAAVTNLLDNTYLVDVCGYDNIKGS